MAVRNGFYYIGENKYPVRPGDEEYVDGEYVWLPDDPSKYVWTNQDDDPIRWADKTLKAGTGFFTQPTCAKPKLTISGEVLQPVENKAYFTFKLATSQKALLCNPFPVQTVIEELVPFSGDPNDGGVIPDDDFKIWWWNPTIVEGRPFGNEVAVRNGFYYIGDNEYPVRPGDEPYVDGEYVWLPDDTSCYVWTNQDDDPIRWVGKKLDVGAGFFTQPTCANPYLCIPNPFYNKSAD